MSLKKGRLSAEEKRLVNEKAGDEAALKRLAKKLNRSVETLKGAIQVAPAVEVQGNTGDVAEDSGPAPIERPEVTDLWGEKSQRKEVGVVVATERTSGRVDKINQKMKRNTVEQILESKPDCTARIR